MTTASTPATPDTESYVFISPTFVSGKPIEVGTIIEFQVKSGEHMELKSLLESAGRIRKATDEDVKDAASGHSKVENQGITPPPKTTEPTPQPHLKGYGGGGKKSSEG